MLTYSLFMWPFGLIAVGAGLQALNRFARRCRAALLPRLVHPVLAGLRADPDQAAALCPAGLSRHGAADRLAADLAADEANAPLKRWQQWLWWSTAFGLVVVSARPGRGLYRRADLSHAHLLLVEHSGGAAALGTGLSALFRGNCRCRCPASAPPRSAPASPIALLFGVIAPSLKPIWLSPAIKAAVAPIVLRHHRAGLGKIPGTEPGVPGRHQDGADRCRWCGASICLPIRPARLGLAPIEDEQKLNGMLSVQGKSVKPRRRDRRHQLFVGRQAVARPLSGGAMTVVDAHDVNNAHRLPNAVKSRPSFPPLLVAPLARAIFATRCRS